jgi:hypothetical protein
VNLCALRASVVKNFASIFSFEVKETRISPQRHREHRGTQRRLPDSKAEVGDEIIYVFNANA